MTGGKLLYAVGAQVTVDDRPVSGHCRAPWYLRGKSGVVVAVLGTFKDPERLAYHKPGVPALPLYKVRFQQTALWANYSGAKADTLEADVYENWLRS